MPHSFMTRALVTALTALLPVGLAAQSALFGTAPVDPFALAAGVCALMLVVALAAYAPSRRATAVDPATALRQ